MKIVLLSLLGVAVSIAAAIGIYWGSWALAEQNQTNQYKVNTNSQQYQAALVDQERDRIQGYDTAAEGAQKAQITSTFCAAYLSLTLPPTDLVLANARICK